MNDMTGNAMRSEDRVHYYALYAGKADSKTLERREQHLSYAARYKGTDGFGPMGPWLVTRDEIPDPGTLDVLCKVGAEVVAEDSTRYLTYGVRGDPGLSFALSNPGTRRCHLHGHGIQAAAGSGADHTRR